MSDPSEQHKPDPRRLRALFDEALRLPAAHRERFARAQGSHGDELVSELLRLLGAADGASPRLKTWTEDASASDRVGPYRVLEVLGEGGMGTVYLAEQRQPIRRRVALKVIKLGMDSKAVLARFEAERQALALLEHSAIARIYDAGTTDRGQPWFAMEYVKGIPITSYCDEKRLDFYQRLQLFQRVCSGVHHAHVRGVMHRDLKPSNILVTLQDEEPTPKIIDFGLAKAVNHQLVEATIFTEQGQIIGTPEYMSPEQAGLSGLDVDVRTDIYSLGVLLYELLTGALPFERSSLLQAGYAEMQRIIRETDPPKPSTRVTTLGNVAAEVALRRQLGAHELRRRLRGDLDWVVMKALEKDRTRRYRTAAELADELDRYRRDEPVLAGPPSMRYRLTRTVRRYPLQILAALLTLSLAAAIAAVWMWQRAETAYAELEQANTSLQKQFQDLREAKATSERLAAEKSRLAESEAMAKAEAEANAGKLAAKVEEFDRLSAIVRYERAVRAEQSLYPAWPTRVQAIELWLSTECEPLLAMRPEIERTIETLRESALPQTDEQRHRDRRAHPRHQEWLLAGKRLASLRYAQTLRTGDPLPSVELTLDQQALEPAALNSLAWERVAPERDIWGEEALGLAAARLAAEKVASGPDRAHYLDTLAWALLANGQDESALRTSADALAAATAEEKSEYQDYLLAITDSVKRAPEILAELEDTYSGLGEEVAQRRTWTFPSELESTWFLHDGLVSLMGKLDRLAEEQAVEVAQRLYWAQVIQQLTLAHPNARVTWPAVREAIATSDRYAGQSLQLPDEQVIGLVPLGANPATGYFEFYHLRSAWDGASDPVDIPIPAHRPDGSIDVTGETGVVFVLLPGGTVTLGAQDADEDAPHYDPGHQSDETVHVVKLSPFFLARHEMTQGQWSRLSSGDESLRQPSLYRAGQNSGGVQSITLANPVEQVDWTMCSRLLTEHGLSLPTEAQWEYGCRGGTTTPWFCSAAELRKYGNVADATAKRAGWQWTCEDWVDGYVVHAPVGAFLPNTFGLHDLHGNVFEWCRDAYGAYGNEFGIDGLRLSTGSSASRVHRGGSYVMKASEARSAARRSSPPHFRNRDLGMRAARRLDGTLYSPGDWGG